MNEHAKFIQDFPAALKEKSYEEALNILESYYKETRDLVTYLESKFLVHYHTQNISQQVKLIQILFNILLDVKNKINKRGKALSPKALMRLLKLFERMIKVNQDTIANSKKLKKFLDSMVTRLGLVMYFDVMDFPSDINIQLTNCCNLNCIMCNHDERLTMKKGFMDPEFVCKLIDEIVQYDVGSISLQNYGESFLHPKLIDIIKYTVNKGIYIRMVTNGTLVDKEMSNKIIDSGLQHITFSVEGYTKERYEKIRPKASFDQVKDNIIYLYSLKKQKNSPLIIELHTEIYQEDEEFKRKYKEFWELFCDKFSFAKLTLFKGISYLDKEGNIIEPDKNPRYVWKTCNFPFRFMVIKHTGEVAPCCVVTGNEIVLGNVKEDSIYNVWHGEKYQNLRELAKKADYSDIPFCATCPIFIEGSTISDEDL